MKAATTVVVSDPVEDLKAEAESRLHAARQRFDAASMVLGRDNVNVFEGRLINRQEQRRRKAAAENELDDAGKELQAALVRRNALRQEFARRTGRAGGETA